MIEFILNNQKIITEKANGSSLLDFIRKDNHLLGTKIGCREGDCGACTVLEGSLSNSELTYKSIVSCLTPLINAHGKHIVTIEGLNMEDLSPVQKSMSDNSATQCGFCTPGFVVSLTGHLLSSDKNDPLQSIGGNICRCTGYKSIEKVAYEIDDLKGALLKGSEIKSMIEKGWLPDYFLSIQKRLSEFDQLENQETNAEILIGGGTDLMVQVPEKVRQASIKSTKNNIPNSIEIVDGKVKIGTGISMNDFVNHQIIILNFPKLKDFFPLIASDQIRNMGTLAGNIVNASPIGDLSILLLALNSRLIIENSNKKTRQVLLKDFFLDYKKIDLGTVEVIKYIVFDTPKKVQKINFEKVSKRTYLDIASVNSAISISINNEIIEGISFSAGGISAIPKFMSQTSNFLKGKKLNVETMESAIEIMQSEISPISDIRGSAEYKRLLLRQLFLQHLLKLFPEVFDEKEILKLMITNTIAI